MHVFCQITAGNEARRFAMDMDKCEIYTAGRLDYENPSGRRYNLTIRASSGTGTKRGSDFLNIDVTDVNDNTPTCDNYTVFGSLHEDAASGTSFAQLACRDVDSYDKRGLHYKVIAGDVDDIEIDGQTAKLKQRITSHLKGHTRQVTVQVRDRARPPHTTNVTVVLHLQHVQVPKFNTSQYHKELSENSTVGTTVLVVTATDGGAPSGGAPGTRNSQITYSLQCQPDLLLVDSVTGAVVTKSTLDTRASQNISCTVHARSWTSGKTSTAKLDVVVNDVNDLRPVFNQTLPYQARMFENATNGSLVTCVLATDGDTGLDGTVRYSLDGASSLFVINDTTGEVRLNGQLDYEIMTSHLVVVVAEDQGLPPKSSSAFLQVIVEPVNEHTPVFHHTNLSFSVPEDTKPGMPVFRLNVTDADAGDDGVIQYSIISSDKPIPFLVDQFSGVVRLANTPLDYETRKTYSFLILATDKSSNPRSATQTLTAYVSDVTDWSITCLPVPPVVVRYPVSNGSSLARVSCSWGDPPGGTFNYSIDEGNQDGMFEMDTSGALRLKNPTNFPDKPRYDLHVYVNSGPGSTFVNFTVFSETRLQFVNFNHTLFVREHSPVVKLTTLSACCTFPQLTYTIVSGNSDNRVSMDSYTGNIYNNVPYDRELQGVYNYVLVATSTSGQSATATLTVSVQDINDHWPEFDRNIYVFKVDESSSVNSVISQITATDKDSRQYARLTYNLTVGTDSASFSIDAGTGSLSLIQGLDYEAKTTLTVEITAADGGVPPKSGTTTVVIQVQNKDEFNSTWIALPGTCTCNLTEDVALGTLVYQVNATGKDMDAIFTYNITNGNTKNDFFIDPASGKVFVNKFLDRERTPSYTLTIVAVNQNGRSVTGTLTVNIQDVNDNYPKFSQNVYVYSFAHGYTGPNIGTLTVTDADEGTNAVVIGKILSGDTQSQFALNNSSLQLTTSQSFDYLGIRRFTLIVEAEDGGSPKLTSTAVVVINVTPASTDAKFNITSDSVTLREDVLVGTQVYDFNATLLGALEDGTISYTMSGGDGEFQIRPNTGQVYVASALDFEKKKESYNLIVFASAVKKRASCTLIVTITNINDNTPSFLSNIVGVTQETFSFVVDENATIDFVVGTVLATDADRGPFGLVSETMTGTSDFVLDPMTGVITVKNKLNYLKKSYYNLLVTASDGGTPAKTAKAYVVIKVNDVNDHSPDFVTTLNTTLLDSVPIGSEVFRFYATDLDTGNAGNVSYVIKSTTGPGLFSLDESTGVLTTTDLLDAAVTSSYTLTITASDHGVPSLATDQTFTITLTATNPNYNTPIFSAPDPDTFTVPRTEPKGTVVGTKSASDNDHGISGQILYTILSGNDDGYFLMNETSGEIRTSTSILTAADSYTFVLRAKDRGTPSRSSTATVTINVTPSRTTNPDPDYSFTVAEDKPAGSEIGRIKVDSPRVPSGYTILAGNLGDSIKEVFNNITKEGLLTVSALDCEKYPEYNLLVEVTTDIGPLTKVVQVTVTDVNDNPPVFSQTAYVISIPENMPVGYTVETIMWSDADVTSANRNNNLTLTPPGDTYFTIDASGHLVIKKSPNYEDTSSISFQVDATDLNVNPQPSASVGVSINLIDVLEEEETPISKVTKNAMISLECPYQASNGHLVYTLTPGDFGIEASPLAYVYYFAYKSSTIPFSVSSSTGQITVTSSSSLENQAKYFHWVLCRSTIGSVTTSKISLLRIDTFDMTSQMVVIEFAEKYSDVVNRLSIFRDRAQMFFSNSQRIGFSNVIDTSTSYRRRLLDTHTAVYTYVVNDVQADDLVNVNNPKTFMADRDILKVLQRSVDGTPVLGLSDPALLDVTVVEPYQAADAADATDFVSSPGAVAMFCLLALVLLVALVLLAVCLCYHKKTDTPRLKRTREERTKEPVSSSKVSDSNGKSTNVQKHQTAALPYTDIFVVAPASRENLQEDQPQWGYDVKHSLSPRYRAKSYRPAPGVSTRSELRTHTSPAGTSTRSELRTHTSTSTPYMKPQRDGSNSVSLVKAGVRGKQVQSTKDGQNISKDGQNIPKDGQNVPKDGKNIPKKGQNIPKKGQNTPKTIWTAYTPSRNSKAAQRRDGATRGSRAAIRESKNINKPPEVKRSDRDERERPRDDESSGTDDSASVRPDRPNTTDNTGHEGNKSTHASDTSSFNIHHTGSSHADSNLEDADSADIKDNDADNPNKNIETTHEESLSDADTPNKNIETTHEESLSDADTPNKNIETTHEESLSDADTPNKNLETTHEESLSDADTPNKNLETTHEESLPVLKNEGVTARLDSDSN
ncbi:protocadherin Fat 4-like [Physella acuta]|uniref:protocadherin Fat 4-like n=1 Tax=Physella acuta TaxID=109671 RepID=UPI0027DBC82D|nr:protocadherin Fat 4-like [Physella acuta]